MQMHIKTPESLTLELFLKILVYIYPFWFPCIFFFFFGEMKIIAALIVLLCLKTNLGD